MNEQDVIINPDGSIAFVYSDELSEVFAGEALQTRRVSEVEPASPSGAFGNEWVASMRLAGSDDVLGPFPTRAEALQAERIWLRENKGL